MNAAVRLPDHLDAEGDSGPQRDPFQTRFDDAFYFDEAVRAKRLNLLFHLVPYSDVLLVTGEQGSGKTCVLQRLLAGANDNWRICHFQATAEIDGVRLLDILHKEFSLRPDGQGDHDQRLRLLRESLHALRHSALVPALVIDDAHLLSHSALTMLGALTEPWQSKDKLLSVVLFGEPEVDKKLIAPGLEALRSRVSHSFDIPPLSEEDTGRYIRHRLVAAGVKSDSAFTDSVIKFIYVASRGFPGRINEFARVVLRNSVQKGAQTEPTASMDSRGRIYLRYGVAAVLVSLVVVTLLYQDRLIGLVTDLKDESSVPASPRTAEPQPEMPISSSVGTGEPKTDTDLVPVVPLTSSESAGSQEAEDATTDSTGQGPPAPLMPAPSEAAAGNDLDVPSAQLAQEHTGPLESEAVQTVGVAGESIEVEAEPSESAASADMGTDSTPIEASAQDEAVSVAAATASPDDEDWLLAQDPASYTLQLLVANRSQCLAYIERHGLGDKAAIFQTQSGGQPFFALVYGIYPTEIDAVDAGKALSEQDVKISSWVRKVAAVQARIREFRATAGAPPSHIIGVTSPQEIRREPWLLEQQADAYTLQLFAGKDANVFAYLKSHALMDKVALFRSVDGAERLAVTYGVYPSKAEALQAAKEVAAQLPDIKPWARPLREIQAAISLQQGADSPSP